MQQPITVNSRKYDLSIRRSWKCELVEQTGDKLTFVGVFDREVDHPDLGRLESGTISYEYYWLSRWYNIFRFHTPDGLFRNYYCNINMPPTFENGVLNYVDLDIDVVVWPDGSIIVLDRDEFEQNAAVYGYPNELKEKAEVGLAELLAMIENNQLP